MNSQQSSVRWRVRLAVLSTISSAFGVSVTLMAGFWPMSWQLALLLIGVSLIGLPHGALDHLFGRELFVENWKQWWFVPFLGMYGAIALLVVAGWWLAPLMTLGGFILLAAIHFAAEELPEELVPHVACWPAALLTGSLLSGVQAVAHPQELAGLINAIIPTGASVAAESIQALGWTWATVAIPGLIVLVGWYFWQSAQGIRRAFVEAIRLLSLVAALVVTPPLVGFVIYFCGWHSLLGWSDLISAAEQEHPGRGFRLVAQAAWPTTLATVAMGLGGATIFGAGLTLDTAAIRTVFIVLSSVAVPHLALHTLLILKDVHYFSFSAVSRAT